MSIHSIFSAAALSIAVAAGVAAQQKANCPADQIVFGIVAITCPSCEVRHDSSGRTMFSFLGEPVVLEIAAGSSLATGDVIEAVNGHPITTAAGSEQLTSPLPGKNEITIRRGRDRHVFLVTAPSCERPSRNGNAPSIRLRGLGQVDGNRAPIVVIDGVISSSPRSFVDNSRTGNFGFAVACGPSCNAATGTEGKTNFTYYKYSVYPPVIAVRAGGAAERAGLKVGDVITKVNGRSVLEDEGALTLWSVFPKDEIQLTVLRAGKEIGFLLKQP